MNTKTRGTESMANTSSGPEATSAPSPAGTKDTCPTCGGRDVEPMPEMTECERVLENTYTEQYFRAESAEAALAQLQQAVREFLAIWQDANAALAPVYTSAHIHGVVYRGPDMSEQLAQLRALIGQQE
jgi:hypothetical protein